MSNPQAESVIRNIIKEICLQCSSNGESVSETLAAFMVLTTHTHTVTHYFSLGKSCCVRP